MLKKNYLMNVQLQAVSMNGQLGRTVIRDDGSTHSESRRKWFHRIPRAVNRTCRSYVAMWSQQSCSQGHSWKLLTINTGLLLSTSKSGSMVCLHSFMNTFCTLFYHFVQVQKELVIHWNCVVCYHVEVWIKIRQMSTIGKGLKMDPSDK